MLTTYISSASVVADFASAEAAPIIAAPAPPLLPIIEAACARVPPLWPLKNFVAVNPFVGLSARHFTDTCHLMRRVAHHETLMTADFYAQAFAAGEITASDLAAALEWARAHWNHGDNEAHWLHQQTPATLLAAFDAPETPARAGDAVLSFADFLDAQHGTRWSGFVVEEIAKWCAAFYDAGQASWAMPWRGLSLFEAWKAAAQLDRNPEIAGVRGFRALVAQLPDDAAQLIAHALDLLGVPRAGAETFLHRQLMSVAGWSGAVQFQAREKTMAGGSDASLIELLAIRLAHDLALFAAFAPDENEAQKWSATVKSAVAAPAALPRDLLTLCVWQNALETAYARGLSAQLSGVHARKAARSTRADVQAIFCIDVRSEVLRRALEKRAGVETLGFAGFFGFAIEHVPLGHRHGSAQCPVLLTPRFRIGETRRGASPDQNAALFAQKTRAAARGSLWNRFKNAPVSAFSFVETSGLGAGFHLARQSFGAKSRARAATKTENELAPSIEATPLAPHSGMALDAQVAAALGALRGMSWNGDFARLVLFCGHGSQTTNNPYASGLDCGACGGHSGESNARVAAAVFNNPAVREALRAHGVFIPDDTHFLAGLHNTTTDEVTLFETQNVPASHRADVAQLQNWLVEAAQLTREARAPALGLEGLTAPQIAEATRARAHDWAQVRPEWGLAGNAAFIAAPRERTRGLDLGGRVFLHSYDHRADADNAILTLIMTATMVVASWINLQYFASTVSNATWGSGNKVLHNVVGRFGVAQGNGGDLQVGLPLQSLHDGQKWVHQPLRLSVFLEAPRESIAQVLAAQPHVRDLVENEWLHLFAIEDEGRTVLRYAGQSHWQRAN